IPTISSPIDHIIVTTFPVIHLIHASPSPRTPARAAGPIDLPSASTTRNFFARCRREKFAPSPSTRRPSGCPPREEPATLSLLRENRHTSVAIPSATDLR